MPSLTESNRPNRPPNATTDCAEKNLRDLDERHDSTAQGAVAKAADELVRDEQSGATRPIRVALIVHTFHVGGLERCIARLASQLDLKRCEPLIVCLNRNDDARQWLTRDVSVLEVGKKPGNDPRSVWRLAQLFRREGVDLVHSHNWGTLVETAVARRLAGVPVHVHAERGMELEDIRCGGWRSAARDRVKRHAMRSATAVVAVSESIRRHLAERGIMPTQKVQVIPNGVEAAQVGPKSARKHIRDRLRLDDNTVLIGSVGRLAPVKDFGLVIRAANELIQRGRDVHLAIVGGGVERETMNLLRRELRIEARCHLVGQQANIGDWLSAMDVYVNCSLNEGMSQSVLEAMAAAKPLVVTDVGDSARLVGGENPCGLIVPRGDVSEFTDALDSLVSDPEKRELFAARAVARHEQDYSAERMITRYEDFYESLMAGRLRERNGGASQ